MKIGSRGDIAGRFRTLFEAGAVAGLSDSELLERSSSGRDAPAELAFAALVERHGPMVLRVCRKALGDPDDAFDAFQSTFFVLARKADSIRDRRSVASWLHGVALRVSSASRSARAKRHRHERAKAALATSAVTLDEPDDVGAVLHEEVGRLPSRYREAVVLCYLEGMSHEQAAGHLDCPVGTVKSRLAWARERLRDRLVRRGLTPAAGAVATILASESAQAGRPLPSSWVDQTTGAAIEFAARSSLAALKAGTVPASASAITARGVIDAMRMNTIKIAATAGFLLLTASSLGVLAQDPARPDEADRIAKLESKLDRLIDALERSNPRPPTADAPPTAAPAPAPTAPPAPPAPRIVVETRMVPVQTRRVVTSDGSIVTEDHRGLSDPHVATVHVGRSEPSPDAPPGATDPHVTTIHRGHTELNAEMTLDRLKRIETRLADLERRLSRLDKTGTGERMDRSRDIQETTAVEVRTADAAPSADVNLPEPSRSPDARPTPAGTEPVPPEPAVPR